MEYSQHFINTWKLSLSFLTLYDFVAQSKAISRVLHFPTIQHCPGFLCYCTTVHSSKYTTPTYVSVFVWWHNMSDWVRLNVGGVSFSCSLSTLCSCPSSVLARMFAKDSTLPPATMVDGHYCIDADPDCFKVSMQRVCCLDQYCQILTHLNVNKSLVW